MICTITKQTGSLSNTGHIINSLTVVNATNMTITNGTNIVAPATGLYMISTNIILDRNFDSIDNELAIFRYGSNGGSQTLLTASKFYSGTCVHTSHMNILAWMDVNAYIQIHALGCVNGGWISVFRIY